MGINNNKKADEDDTYTRYARILETQTAECVIRKNTQPTVSMSSGKSQKTSVVWQSKMTLQEYFNHPDWKLYKKNKTGWD